MKTIKYADWLADGERRFGADRLQWRFACPSCGHIASVADWRTAGAPEGAVAFSCVGRYLADRQGAADAAFKNKGGPCNYTTGGLFNISPISIELEGGDISGAFAFAEAVAPLQVPS